MEKLSCTQESLYYLEIPLKAQYIHLQLVSLDNNCFLLKTRDSYSELIDYMEQWLDENKKMTQNKYQDYILKRLCEYIPSFSNEMSTLTIPNLKESTIDEKLQDFNIYNNEISKSGVQGQDMILDNMKDLNQDKSVSLDRRILPNVIKETTIVRKYSHTPNYHKPLDVPIKNNRRSPTFSQRGSGCNNNINIQNVEADGFSGENVENIMDNEPFSSKGIIDIKLPENKVFEEMELFSNPAKTSDEWLSVLTKLTIPQESEAEYQKLGYKFNLFTQEMEGRGIALDIGQLSKSLAFNLMNIYGDELDDNQMDDIVEYIGNRFFSLIPENHDVVNKMKLIKILYDACFIGVNLVSFLELLYQSVEIIPYIITKCENSYETNMIYETCHELIKESKDFYNNEKKKQKISASIVEQIKSFYKIAINPKLTFENIYKSTIQLLDSSSFYSYVGMYNSSNQANGNGKLFYNTGALYYEGNFVNGNKEGENCILYHKTGYKMYMGNIVNDQKSGHGTFLTKKKDYDYSLKSYVEQTYKLEGTFNESLVEGYGKLYLDGFLIKEGNYRYSQLTSEQCIQYRNGKIIYKGGMRLGFKHGRGIQWIGERNRWIDGTFDMNELNLKLDHAQYFRNMKVAYHGKLDNEFLKNGQGKSYNEEGELIEEGKYFNNQAHDIDFVLFISDCKKIYQGNMKDGKKNGFGILYYPNGKIMFEGNFYNNCIHGEDVSTYWENGNIKFKGEIKYGKKNGFVKEYYERNGIQFEGIFVNGIKHGHAKQYNENGEVIFDGKFVDDKKQS